MATYHRLIDANLARVAEGLRVIEDICRFELSAVALVTECKACRDQLKAVAQTFNHTQLVNARSVGNDVRANAPVPDRQNLRGLLIANIRRATEGCRSLEESTNNQQFSALRYAIYTLEHHIMTALQRRPLTGPGIYVVSDDPNHLIECAKKPFVPIVQYRNKAADKATIYSACKTLREQIAADDALFMINDHVDIAIACQADGIHVGQDDIPTPIIRSMIGETCLIGRTTHTFEQGQHAAMEGADYVSVGPIWETPSKPDRAGIGLDYLKNAHQLGIPYVAIGGIGMAQLPTVMAYDPPLLGAIRAAKSIDELWQAMQQSQSI
ncbi:MAG: thiamine phosphate synthase [Candidatus Marinamargulisbacteria bacterium]